MTTRHVVLLSLAAAALPALAKDQSAIELGQTSAQVRVVLGEPRWTSTLGAKQVLGFATMKVSLVSDKVIEIQIWRSCEAQGRGDQPGCRLPGADALVQPLPLP